MIYYDAVYYDILWRSVCDEKSSLPTSELSSGGEKWAARSAVSRLWPSVDDDGNGDNDDNGDDDEDQEEGTFETVQWRKV